MKQLNQKLYINGVDINAEYGVFLYRDKGFDNASAILKPSSTKVNLAVNFRERNGELYPNKLLQVNEARDVTLKFCLYAATRPVWLDQYKGFVNFIKTGIDGWLNINLPDISMTIRVYYKSCSSFDQKSCIWLNGQQASVFSITFREPQPTI